MYVTHRQVSNLKIEQFVNLQMINVLIIFKFYILTLRCLIFVFLNICSPFIYLFIFVSNTPSTAQKVRLQLLCILLFIIIKI